MSERVTIYALCSADGDVEYVGQTRYPAQRQRQHERVWPEWTMRVLMEVDSACANDVEQQLIADYEGAGHRLANWTHTERARCHMRAVALGRPRRPRCDTVGVSLRLPRALHARLGAIAKHEGRSLQQQMVYFIEQGIAARAQAAAARQAGPDHGEPEAPINAVALYPVR